MIREEYIELEKDIFLNEDENPDRLELCKGEAIQLAAMSVRFLIDFCKGNVSLKTMKVTGDLSDPQAGELHEIPDEENCRR